MLSYVLLCVSQFLFMVMRGTFLPSDTLHCFSSVAQWRLQATEHLICCEDVVELHPPVWKEEKQFDLPHSWLVNYLSFLAVIVSIDTTQHLTPTGLHNLMFLPGTHTSPHRHISTHTHTHKHTHTHSITFLMTARPHWLCLRGARSWFLVYGQDLLPDITLRVAEH